MEKENGNCRIFGDYIEATRGIRSSIDASKNKLMGVSSRKDAIGKFWMCRKRHHICRKTL